MSPDVMFRHNVQIRDGVRASVLQYQRPSKYLVCQFRYNIGGEMPFYQENTREKIFRNATIHRKFINLRAVQRIILILAFCVLLLGNKLELVHLKVMSNINQKSNNP